MICLRINFLISISNSLKSYQKIDWVGGLEEMEGFVGNFLYIIFFIIYFIFTAKKVQRSRDKKIYNKNSSLSDWRVGFLILQILRIIRERRLVWIF